MPCMENSASRKVASRSCSTDETSRSLAIGPSRAVVVRATGVSEADFATRTFRSIPNKVRVMDGDLTTSTLETCLNSSRICCTFAEWPCGRDRPFCCTTGSSALASTTEDRQSHVQRICDGQGPTGLFSNHRNPLQSLCLPSIYTGQRSTGPGESVRSNAFQSRPSLFQAWRLTMNEPERESATWTDPGGTPQSRSASDSTRAAGGKYKQVGRAGPSPAGWLSPCGRSITTQRKWTNINVVVPAE